MVMAQIPAMNHDPRRPEDVLKFDVDEDDHGSNAWALILNYVIALP